MSANRIDAMFAQLKADGKKTVIPYITAGFPTLDATAESLKAIEAAGVQICEIGIPFTDPIADGPVIQASHTEALNAGCTCAGIWDVVRSYRESGGKMALLAMVTFSIVFRNGVDTFVKAATEAGIDGFIVPDLPVEASAEYRAAFDDCNARLVQLVAPTTTPERRKAIVEAAGGFIYYISIAGVTGERRALPEKALKDVTEIKSQTETPVCIGFGVSDAAAVAEVCKFADGAIVGSAIVRRMDAMKTAAASDIAAEVGSFVSGLLEPLK